MELNDFIRSNDEFPKLSQAEQVKLLGWFILFYRSKDRFTTTDIRRCYDALHMQLPNISDVLSRLEARRPKVVLKDSRGGWKLEMQVRHEMDTRYGNRPISIAIEKSLTGLPGRLTDETKRKYLEEALKCYKATAFRAAILMTWNLAYDHLVNWILADATRLAALNTKLPRKPPFYVGNPPVPTGKVITSREDFEAMTEREVIEAAGHKDILIISDNLKKILVQNLDRRNISTHPATIEVTQLNAEDTMSNLVENIVLRLT